MIANTRGAVILLHGRAESGFHFLDTDANEALAPHVRSPSVDSSRVYKVQAVNDLV